MKKTLTVDGAQMTVDITPADSLLHIIRTLGFTAPKAACNRGECGACTVLVGSVAVLSCVSLAVLVDQPVTTAAGLGDGDRDLREAFADEAGFQCGFCTPGQVVRAAALLRDSPAATREDITRAMVGNICRCTGYVQIVDAIAVTAQRRRDLR